MRDQGTMVDCVYCTEVRPELKGSENCPVCHGNTPHFQPMRMMDACTSRIETLNKILHMHPHDDLEPLKTQLLGLLQEVVVYNFDIKEALIDYIKNIEES